jgi:RsiW-degrading membrane proteinase PrsW (M82 family)
MIFLYLVIVTFLAIAGSFALYLVKRDKGEREPVGALWKAFGLGVLGLVAAAFIEYRLLPDPSIVVLTLPKLAAVSLGIGAIEELVKSLPLALLLYRKRYFNEHTDGVIYFALVGLGFGLPENILYTLQEGPKTGLGRVILTPLFHAATTAIIGYALARVKIDHVSKWRFVGAVLAAIFLHGLYDFGLFSHSGLLTLLSIAVTAALTVGVFALFMRSKHLDEQQGLSVVGHNSFCRSCGHPNPKHNLYCTHCGNRA